LKSRFDILKADNQLSIIIFDYFLVLILTNHMKIPFSQKINNLAVLESSIKLE